MTWAEFDMREACAEVRKKGGIRKAAVKFHIPYPTLRGRINGRLPHAVAHQDQQRLSIEQEDLLADWVLFQGSIWDPLRTQLSQS